MQQSLRFNSTVQRPYSLTSLPIQQEHFNGSVQLGCNWYTLRLQLLQQWTRLSNIDIDEAGPCLHKLAALIQRKYGIEANLVENYLCNFERTLPVM